MSGVAATIAEHIGSSEGAIKLLLSIFIGYPLAFLYRSPLVYHLPPAAKHVFFIIAGYAICHYNFGLETLHLVANVTVIHLLLMFLGGTKFSIIFALVFNTAYLITGYYYQMWAEFGISWTMPMCVITLRLTAVTFDLYDGLKKSKTDEFKDTALTTRPSYLEMLGHTFFFGGVMIGPQFPMKRYLSFVNGEFSNNNGGPPASVSAGLGKLGLGIAYILAFQLFALYIPDSYLQSEDFMNLGFFTKCALILLWGKNAVNKYIGVWIATEGSIMLTGMSYNGLTKEGLPRWDGCCNIKVWDLETGERFSDFIRSFNVNTNQWMARYIFKRLRFLGSKVVSQCVTMFYLALWHGTQSGYFMCFFLELVQTNAETEWLSVWKRCQTLGVPQGGPLTWIGRVVRKAILLFMWSYALLSFVMLDYTLWLPIHNTVYHAGLVLPMLMVLSAPVLRAVLPHKPIANGVTPGVTPDGQEGSELKAKVQ